jgi:hypothetical protein
VTRATNDAKADTNRKDTQRLTRTASPTSNIGNNGPTRLPHINNPQPGDARTKAALGLSPRTRWGRRAEGPRDAHCHHCPGTLRCGRCPESHGTLRCDVSPWTPGKNVQCQCHLQPTKLCVITLAGVHSLSRPPARLVPLSTDEIVCHHTSGPTPFPHHPVCLRENTVGTAHSQQVRHATWSPGLHPPQPHRATAPFVHHSSLAGPLPFPTTRQAEESTPLRPHTLTTVLLHHMIPWAPPIATTHHPVHEPLTSESLPDREP